MSRTTLICTFALACALSVDATAYTIFMTADEATGPSSQLHGFYQANEVFAVDASTASAFQGVSTLKGDVLVADYGEEVIQRFDIGGNLLTPFASIQDPTFLESDSSNNVYTTASSLGPAVATRFDYTGTVTQTYSSPTGQEFRGIDADSSGNVYIAVQYANPTSYSIEKYDAAGTFLSSTPVDATPFDLAIDEAGKRLFLADEDPATGGIKVYGISGAAPVYMNSIPVPTDSVMSGVSYSSNLDRILVTDSGAISDTPRGWDMSPDGYIFNTYIPSGADVAFDIIRVPEPSSLMLALLAISGVTWYRRR